jgi:hypothetical protein
LFDWYLLEYSQIGLAYLLEVGLIACIEAIPVMPVALIFRFAFQSIFVIVSNFDIFLVLLNYVFMVFTEYDFFVVIFATIRRHNDYVILI